jgi:hypothetical protein
MLSKSIYGLIKPLVSVIMLVSVLMLPCLSLASVGPADRLKALGNDSGYETASKDTDLPTIIGTVIGVFLTLLGIIFLALFVYAGFMWMIAAGGEEKVTKSKDTMRRAIIGLIIVIASYAISQYVIYSLVN